MTTSAAENRGDKEKVEKRRALGRGLDSLLPGPRVVAGNVGRPAVAPPPSSSSGSGSSGAGGTQTGVSAAHVPVVAANVAVDNPAELRSAGQPGAAVPTPSSSISSSSSISPTDDSPIEINAMAEPARVPGNLVINVAISDIDKNPFQTRYISDDDKLEELADSIKANGVVQPIVVRPSEEDAQRYVLVVGERRLHASKKAGKTTIPAMVRRISLQQAAEMTIIENLQRDDLSPLEQAEAFRVLSRDFSLTQVQIGQRVGLSRESVANYMRLLKLPREVMELLAEKKMSFAHARELLQLENDDQIAKAAEYA